MRALAGHGLKGGDMSRKVFESWSGVALVLLVSACQSSAAAAHRAHSEASSSLQTKY
jgi:hypothetical protein